jgi:hypothetical protein
MNEGEGQTRVSDVDYLALSDTELLAQCDVDTHRAHGPGGQHRNKVETAVRIRHRPTGLSVIAEESRFQAENRARALKRLRKALALRVRRPVADDATFEAVRACIGRDGRLRVGQRDVRYLPALAEVLDLLQKLEGSVGAAAERLGLTTGNLSSFLTADDDLLVEANRLRAEFGLKPLRRD